MYFKPLFIFALAVPAACSNSASTANKKNHPATAVTGTKENPYARVNTISLPDGYARRSNDAHSFAAWLGNLSLKKDRTVHLFDGRLKTNQDAQFAVVDMPVGNKDLQQCADAVMRLRAGYLFDNNRFAEISFTDNANKQYQFEPPYTQQHFQRFMDQVFGMCGSASLAKQLRPAVLDSIEPGDVLIRGGFPGHAVMVMDVAQNSSGKKIYLLAQSYMPAQDIHVLKDPANEALSPWYEVNDDENIMTPEYLFHRNELKKW